MFFGRYDYTIDAKGRLNFPAKFRDAMGESFVVLEWVDNCLFALPLPEVEKLAEKLEVSPAAVAVSLKKLEKSGHISRACDELDNRMNRVVITEKGKKAIEISHRYFGEIEDFLLQDFSCEEMEALSDYLKRIMKNGEN